MKKTYLVTGGAGFLGSHLCAYLIKKGITVLCVDNLITGNTVNLSALYGNKNFKFIKHDINKPLYLKVKLDYVFHMASPASPVDYLTYPMETLKVGSIGTLNALGIAKNNNSKFFLASTSEIYGDPLSHPQKEEYWGNVNCVGVRSVYDEAKRFAEALTMAYHRKYKLDTKIVRIFNTYGPRMRPNDGRAIPNFICQALSNKPLTVYGRGAQTRSFCYVDDLIEGIFRLSQSKINQPLNIGNPKETKLIDIARKIIKLTKSKSSICFKDLPQDDPKQRRPDIAKARKCLGWEPKIKLDYGLLKTIEWFRQFCFALQ